MGYITNIMRLDEPTHVKYLKQALVRKKQSTTLVSSPPTLEMIK